MAPKWINVDSITQRCSLHETTFRRGHGCAACHRGDVPAAVGSSAGASNEEPTATTPARAGGAQDELPTANDYERQLQGTRALLERNQRDREASKARLRRIRQERKRLAAAGDAWKFQLADLAQRREDETVLDRVLNGQRSDLESLRKFDAALIACAKEREAPALVERAEAVDRRLDERRGSRLAETEASN